MGGGVEEGSFCASAAGAGRSVDGEGGVGGADCSGAGGGVLCCEEGVDCGAGRKEKVGSGGVGEEGFLGCAEEGVGVDGAVAGVALFGLYVELFGGEAGEAGGVVAVLFWFAGEDHVVSAVFDFVEEFSFVGGEVGVVGGEEVGEVGGDVGDVSFFALQGFVVVVLHGGALDAFFGGKIEKGEGLWALNAGNAIEVRGGGVTGVAGGRGWDSGGDQIGGSGVGVFAGDWGNVGVGVWVEDLSGWCGDALAGGEVELIGAADAGDSVEVRCGFGAVGVVAGVVCADECGSFC